MNDVFVNDIVLFKQFPSKVAPLNLITIWFKVDKLKYSEIIIIYECLYRPSVLHPCPELVALAGSLPTEHDAITYA